VGLQSVGDDPSLRGAIESGEDDDEDDDESDVSGEEGENERGVLPQRVRSVMSKQRVLQGAPSWDPKSCTT
jgi:hypothetical protein